MTKVYPISCRRFKRYLKNKNVKNNMFYQKFKREYYHGHKKTVSGFIQ